MKHLHIRPYHKSDDLKFVKIPKDEQDRTDTIKDISGYGLPVEIDENGIASVAEFQIETVDGWYPAVPTKIENLKLEYFPSQCLSTYLYCLRHVKPSSSAVTQKVLSMLALMYMAKGVGLASNQVGLDWMVCVMDENFNPYIENKITPRILFDLEISDKPHAVEYESKEGCLSVPGASVLVPRWNSIKVKYTDINYKQNTWENPGQFASAILQHENDHLEGKCIYAYMSKSEKEKYRTMIKRYRREQKKQNRNK